MPIFLNSTTLGLKGEQFMYLLFIYYPLLQFLVHVIIDIFVYGFTCIYINLCHAIIYK